MNKPSKNEVIVNVAVFLWIFVVNVVAAIVSPIPTWPMFFVTIFYFTLGADPKNIAKIFLSGAMGLVFALLFALALQYLAPVIGIVPVLCIALFVILGLVIVGGGYLPIIFNNITFAYMTIGTINMEIIGDMFLNWMIMLILGGAIILGGALVVLNIVMKQLAKKG